MFSWSWCWWRAYNNIDIPIESAVMLDQWRRRCNGEEDDVMVPSLLSRQNAPLVLGSTGDG
jgi:hypothetical protein